MKKFYFSAAALMALSVPSAQAQEIELLPMQEREVQYATAQQAPSAAPTATAVAKAGTAPASIVGKKFVTFFDSFTNYGEAAGWFSVEAAGDSVNLVNVADGYSLKGKYDATTGKISIPTGMVIGKTSSGDEIKVHNLLASSGYSKYNDTPVVGTFSGDKVTFADGFYAAATKGGGYVWMEGIKGIEANGSLKTAQLVFSTLEPNVEYEYPVYVTKVADNKIMVQGLANWKYGHNYKVPFTITKSTNSAQLLTTDSVDWYKSSDGAVQSLFMLYRNQDNVNSVSQNPKFTVAAGDTSTITSQKILFEGYQKAGTTSWSGWLLRPFVISMNFNVYETPVPAVEIGDLKYVFDNVTNTATVIGCNVGITAANIPETVEYEGETYTVTGIGEKAFYNMKTITQVSIPATIKNIASYAFQNATGIQEVKIADMKAWCAITIPNYYASPIYYAHYNTDKTKWGKVYFNNKLVTTDLEVPEGVTSIVRSFAGFKTLVNVTLPSTLKKLGDQAFYNCTDIKTMVIPEGTETLGSAFYSCTGLTEIVVPGSVSAIGISAFSGCKALTKVTLNEGLKSIDNSAFYNCLGLEELVLPSTVTTLGSTPFGLCKNIKKFTSRAVTPPTVGADNPFSAFSATASLYVPSEDAKTAYAEARGWKEFTTILVDATGIDGISADDAQHVRYFNLQGMEIAAPVKGQLVIKMTGNKSEKLIAR